MLLLNNLLLKKAFPTAKLFAGDDFSPSFWKNFIRNVNILSGCCWSDIIASVFSVYTFLEALLKWLGAEHGSEHTKLVKD